MSGMSPVTGTVAIFKMPIPIISAIMPFGIGMFKRRMKHIFRTRYLTFANAGKLLNLPYSGQYYVMISVMIVILMWLQPLPMIHATASLI